MTDPTLPEAFKSLRVLLVDDDWFVLDIVESMLRELGLFNIVRAQDGAEALGAIDIMAEPPQLLICDLNMPGMDGIQFFRHLAERWFEGGVILSSGSDMRLLKTVESLLIAHNLRFLGTLQKPIEEASLLNTILKLGVPEPAKEQEGLLQMLLPEEIEAGLQAGQLEVFVQPKVDIADRHVVGAECLARWRHPQRGLLQPDTFISVAEEFGLIDRLTLAVFHQAMHYLGAWAQLGHDLKLSVNVSMDSLMRLDLPEQLGGIAHEAGVAPQRVILEMTESRLMSHLATSLEVITRLRLKGFGLSIDDFGTGYSSMEKLKLLPFTELKIDRAFVFGAAEDAAARGILELSVQTGKALGMRIIAEGAETQQDWDLVAAVGCDEVQGYVVARPMPAELFIAWKNRWESQL